MNTLTDRHIKRADFWLLITTVAYLLLNGAQIFETAVIVPVWTASPPESFHIFQGNYGLDFKVFWIISHSIHELTFILAIIFNWKISNRRKWLLMLFAIHMVMRAWTLAYFAPNIIAFQHLSSSTMPDDALQQKTMLWKNLNYLRVAVFLFVSFALIPLNKRISSSINTD